ncbi:hypothetical protein K3N28_16990 [Glycomyces sp. TRM65418]|uniref:hypothetical protein n=1 Tax=Glycomyces sp. TRM65418 TaxID=2867006 RepID=UPI001CE6900B|nr:hypothetical protein [Glycomyces sp. TRM65418]MCC3764755.1 hypothetical protein [Glycomyces sp. TRM65418]QZD54409.1 hypothetical protein K3N28_16905 [Glycomyces sp. TRM65418]
MFRSERSAGGARPTGGRRLRAAVPGSGARRSALAAARSALLGGRAAWTALLVAALAAFAPVAPAAAKDPCTGVTVVVDFGTLAAEPATGCAADPENGLDALVQAGFSVTEVVSIRGMVCRIDELPEIECGTAPPALNYWSYWRADADDAEWTYSAVGGGDARPEAGDVEGWALGDGSSPPALTPAEAAASSSAAEPEAAQERSFTWLIAVAALLVIAVLVVWRLRRDRRA